jgi:hypothetical protein
VHSIYSSPNACSERFWARSSRKGPRFRRAREMANLMLATCRFAL